MLISSGLRPACRLLRAKTLVDVVIGSEVVETPSSGETSGEMSDETPELQWSWKC